MNDPRSDWVPPPTQVTHPDQLPGEAWRAVELIDGEAVLNVWKTPRGFLVLTNLRCFGMFLELDLFSPHQWHTGPEFLFYNFRAPTVAFGRFVVLEEEVQEAGAVGRFLVHDPPSVAATIAAALGPGRSAWRARRQHTEEMLHARQSLRAQRAAGVDRPVVLVRCSYCGNTANAALRRCPSCGATLG